MEQDYGKVIKKDLTMEKEIWKTNKYDNRYLQQ